jgi:hypothetical protein
MGTSVGALPRPSAECKLGVRREVLSAWRRGPFSSLKSGTMAGIGRFSEEVQFSAVGPRCVSHDCQFIYPSSPRARASRLP